MTRADDRNQGENASAPEGAGWLDLLPVLWLVIVASAYALLVIPPLAPATAPVFGLDRIEAVAAPLLVCLGVAGILRYYRLRGKRAAGETPEGARPDEGRETL